MPPTLMIHCRTNEARLDWIEMALLIGTIGVPLPTPRLPHPLTEHTLRVGRLHWRADAQGDPRSPPGSVVRQLNGALFSVGHAGFRDRPLPLGMASPLGLCCYPESASSSE